MSTISTNLRFFAQCAICDPPRGPSPSDDRKRNTILEAAEAVASNNRAKTCEYVLSASGTEKAPIGAQNTGLSD